MLCGEEGRGRRGRERQGKRDIVFGSGEPDRMTLCVRQPRVSVGGELEVSLT